MPEPSVGVSGWAEVVEETIINSIFQIIELVLRPRASIKFLGRMEKFVEVPSAKPRTHKEMIETSEESPRMVALGGVGVPVDTGEARFGTIGINDEGVNVVPREGRNGNFIYHLPFFFCVSL